MEKESEQSIWVGIIGAFIGASIAVIPWVLAYVYLEMILSLLAMLIAAGALMGYKVFKGKINEKLPIIIIVVSLIVITIATLIVIPLLLIAKEGFAVTFGNFKSLYQYETFAQAITKDYVVSIVFSLLGISAIVTNIKNQLREDPNNKDIKAYHKNQSLAMNKQVLNEVKETFLSLGAMSKETAIKKKDIVEKMTVNNPAWEFENFRMQQIIRKHRGKYYFSEKAASNLWYRFLPLFLKIFILMLIFLLPIILFL